MSVDTSSILYKVGQAVKAAAEGTVNSNNYSEPTFSSGVLQSITTWTDSGKGTKVSSKAFTYTDGNLTSVVEKDGSDVTTLTKTLTYDVAGNLASITKDYADASGSWTPSQITTLAWYDASDSSTITKNATNEVSVWADKSGNSNDLTGVDNPVTGASTQNSLNVINLDGGDYFELNTLSTPTSGNLQAFIVCNVTNVDNNADSILAMDASSNDWQLQAGKSGSFQGSITFSNQTNSNTGSGGTDLSGYHIYCADLDFTDDGQFQLLLDGEQIANQRPYSSRLASTVDFKIFANRVESQFPEGAVAEVILIDSTSNIDREKVEGYLAHKWGLVSLLDASHPYKTSQPLV